MTALEALEKSRSVNGYTKLYERVSRNILDACERGECHLDIQLFTEPELRASEGVTAVLKSRGYTVKRSSFLNPDNMLYISWHNPVTKFSY